jgi:hypothetical protein
MRRSGEGIEWSLVGGSGQTLLLDRGHASGSGGCNRFAGGYELEGERLSFKPLASTRMACDPTVMQAESDYFLALGRTARLALADAELFSTTKPRPSCSGSPERPASHERSP